MESESVQVATSNYIEQGISDCVGVLVIKPWGRSVETIHAWMRKTRKNANGKAGIPNAEAYLYARPLHGRKQVGK
jgi:hypothetical protein